MATWNASTEAVPAQADAPSTLGTTARADRVNVRERMENEHTSYTTKGGTSGGSATADFLHKAGSAKAYYEASAPTVRPDGSTALAAADAGRIWVDSAGKEAWVWDGSAFARIVPSATTTLLLSSAVVSGNVQTSTLTANAVTATSFIGAVTRGIKSITATGDWTVPANITRVKVRVVGAGGNGGSGIAGTDGGYGGGGGAGGYTEGVYDLTAAEISTLTVSVVVGVPGSGTSSFGAHASATGGSAGSNGSSSSGAGGAGGLGVGGSDAVNLYGPAGGSKREHNSGGDGFFGQGGNAPDPTGLAGIVGEAGTGPGSGGSGGVAISSGTYAGGAGADGIVIVEW